MPCSPETQQIIAEVERFSGRPVQVEEAVTSNTLGIFSPQTIERSTGIASMNSEAMILKGNAGGHVVIPLARQIARLATGEH